MVYPKHTIAGGSRYIHAWDRFEKCEYLIDQGTYQYVLDLIRFYQDSLYLLPDEERIRVRKIVSAHETSDFEVPVNHLLFE